ncbi:hypothetical protein F9B74_08250 [Pelistega sp. NLN82]|uniref:HNH endonuclease n=1 Tax=Pelistega ratti TaxID=2652177 RepID=A0A6L9Y742_9BURK|nr:HNH endonuclease [Pelistega ratti]NEN76312.1 hypothetical protein [Pelistega ratti]
MIENFDKILKSDTQKERFSDWVDRLDTKSNSLDSKIDNTFAKDILSGFLPTGGKWEGEKGRSVWTPDPDIKPDPENKKNGNPNNLTWGEILKKYDVTGIEYEDGYPIFDPFVPEINGEKAEVEIENFTTDRNKNFAAADKALAEKVGMKPEEIHQYRKDNNFTWHECEDCKTMQLVPTEIHNNVPHKGGISVAKQQ